MACRNKMFFRQTAFGKNIKVYVYIKHLLLQKLKYVILNYIKKKKIAIIISLEKFYLCTVFSRNFPFLFNF